MKEAQQLVDEYIQANGGYWPPNNNLLRLMEEVGEVAREFNHRFGPKKKKASEDNRPLQEELGDVLFTLIAIANQLDLNLDECLEIVLAKYRSRDKNRWTTPETPNP